MQLTMLFCTALYLACRLQVREKKLFQCPGDRRVLQLNVELIEGDIMKPPYPAKNPCVVTLIEV